MIKMRALSFSAAVLLCSIGVTLCYPYEQDSVKESSYWPSYSSEMEAESQDMMEDNIYLGSPHSPESEVEAQDMMGDNRYLVGFPYSPDEEAEVQSRSLQIGTSYRLLHHHCDDPFTLYPRTRYFLRIPLPGDDRWGVSTCTSCQFTKIHFSSSTGGTIRSGDRVMVVAPNDAILKCDSSKCPKQYSSYRFNIYKCGGSVGDAIKEKTLVMLYATHNGKECQVSFNRADPMLWCPGTPLHKPPTTNECYNSCGTGVYVLPK